MKAQRQYHNVCYTKYGWTDGYQAWCDKWEPLTKFHVFQEEKCPTTGNLHYQGYMEFKNKLGHGRLKALDANMHFGARYPKSTPAQAAAYCTKDDTRITGPWETGLISRPGTRTDMSRQNAVYSEALDAPSVEDALALIRAGAPRDLCLHGESIRRNLNMMFTPKFKHEHTIDQFLIPAKEFPKDRRALHFWGPHAMGKTDYALAHFENPLLVRHVDKLKKLTPDHDGIVFDEMTFLHWAPESVRTLCDIAHESDIHCRNICGVIPAGVKRIFCTQKLHAFYKPEVDTVDQDAIESRLVHYHINERIFTPDEFTRM